MISGIFDNNQIIYAIGVTILHSLWQIAIIFLILNACLYFLRESAAVFRYRIRLISMILILISVTFTFNIVYDANGELTDESLQTVSKNQHNRALPVIQFDQVTDPGNEEVIHSNERQYRTYIPYISAIYFVGLSLLIIRLLFSFIYIHRFKVRGIVSPPEKIITQFNRLKKIANVSFPVQLVESTIARTPMVLGYLRPMIIVPVGLFTQLPFNQVEVILLHELAHIRRNDYLVNILQSVFELIFFYHPLIYYISAGLRAEREHCCDDSVLLQINDRKTYLQALAGVEELSLNPHHLAVAFKNKNILLNRVKRIINYNTMKSKLTDRLFAGVLILAGILIIAVTGAAKINILGMVDSDNSKTSIHLQNSIVKKLSGDSIIEFNENRIVTIKEDEKGNPHKFEILFEGGKISELYVDEKKVPEEDIPNYKKQIIATLDEVKKTKKQLEHAEQELAEVNAEKIEIELERARKEIKEINEEEIREKAEQARREAIAEMEEARRELENAKVEMEFDRAEARAEMEAINWDSIRRVVDSSLNSVNWEEIKAEVDEALKEARTEMSEEEFKRAMEEAEKALDMSMEEVERAIQTGMEEAMRSLENIDWDIIGESVKMSLNISQDVLIDLEKTIATAMKEIDGIDPVRIEKEIEESRKEISREREKLDKLERDLEKSVKELK